MFISKFSTEDWQGNQNHGSIKEAINWNEIETAIRELDGHRRTLDLLRESRRSKFKIKDSRNKIESQTKTFASITISFSQNPKYFKFAVNMFNNDSQSR